MSVQLSACAAAHSKVWGDAEFPKLNGGSFLLQQAGLFFPFLFFSSSSSSCTKLFSVCSWNSSRLCPSLVCFALLWKMAKSVLDAPAPAEVVPPRRASAPQHFPTSNVRETPDEPPTPLHIEWRPRPIRIKLLKLAKDHLLALPKVNHRYVSVRGTLLFDSRYATVRNPRQRSRKRKHSGCAKAQSRSKKGRVEPVSQQSRHSLSMSRLRINRVVCLHISPSIISNRRAIGRGDQVVPSRPSGSAPVMSLHVTLNQSKAAQLTDMYFVGRHLSQQTHDQPSRARPHSSNAG